MPILPTKKLVKFLVLLCSSSVLLCFLIPNITFAFTKQINYQGKLTSSSGSAVSDGSYTIVFKLHDALTGGNTVWTETDSITTKGGLFSLMLGANSSLDNVNFNQSLYLSLNVNGDGEMTPRKTIGSVASALSLNGNASSTAIDVSNYLTVNGTTTSNIYCLGSDGCISSWGTTVSPWTDTGNVLTPTITSRGLTINGTTTIATTTVNGNLNVDQYLDFSFLVPGWVPTHNVVGPSSFAIGSGLTSTGVGAFTLGSFNSAIGDGSFALGLGNVSVFSGSMSLGILNYSSGPASLAGGVYSTSTGDAAFSFGTNNIADGDRSVVLGGTTNLAYGADSFVGGGTYNIASGTNSVILGGNNNILDGNNSLIIGGFDSNRVDAERSIIIGGISNYASGGSLFGAMNATSTNGGVVVGSNYNQAIAGNSVAIGGATNISSGLNGGVFSGEGNLSSGLRAVVIGGNGNTASGTGAGVYTGHYNIASGNDATVLGGIGNVSSGNYSVVLGGGNSTSSGENSAVLGGTNNEVSGHHSLALDGNQNTVSGDFSYAIGGQNNVVSGDGSYSFGDKLTISGTSSIGFNLDGVAYTVSDDNVMAIMGGNVGLGTTSPKFGLVIGDGSIASSVQIPRGGICVDDDGWCTVPTAGIVYADNFLANAGDLAENYQAFEAGLEPGDIVSVSDLNSATTSSDTFGLRKAQNRNKLLGVVSTKPGVTLMYNENNPNQVPVALSGRVPVKVNLEGGPISVGDAITLSSAPGVGAKATTSAETIGIALEGFNNPDQGQIMVFIKLGYTHVSSQITNGNIAENGLWTLDDLTGQIKANSSVSLGGFDLTNVHSLSLVGGWGIDEKGLLKVNSIEVSNSFKLGSPDKRLGMTLYDEQTGDPYCLSVSNGAIKNVKGECPETQAVGSSFSSGVGSGDDLGSSSPLSASTTNGVPSGGSSEILEAIPPEPEIVSP